MFVNSLHYSRNLEKSEVKENELFGLSEFVAGAKSDI
jgi:hypothetical protein